MSAALLTMLLAAGTPEVGVLAAEAERAFRSGDFAAAAALYGRLAGAAPADAGVHFNHAAALARAGELEAALAALTRAADAGFPHAGYLDATPDLAPVRGLEGYPEILAKVKENGAALRARRRAAEDAVRAAEAALAGGRPAAAGRALDGVDPKDAPEPASALFLRARAWAGVGASAEAVAALSAALDAGLVDTAAMDGAPELTWLKGTAKGRALWRRATGARRALEQDTRRTVVRRGKGPTMLALHGFGQDPESFADVLAAALPAVGVVAVRGPSAAPGGGRGWEDLQRTQVALGAALGDAGVDGRPVLLGFSQGGWLGLRWSLLHPARLKGAIIVGTSRFEPPGPDALQKVAALRIPVAILAGEGDPAAVEAAREAERVLSAAEIRVKVWVVPGLGHALPPAEILRAAWDFVRAPWP
jgi:predicted esterase